jgi:hypothetical protein
MVSQSISLHAGAPPLSGTLRDHGVESWSKLPGDAADQLKPTFRMK